MDREQRPLARFDPRRERRPRKLRGFLVLLLLVGAIGFLFRDRLAGFMREGKRCGWTVQGELVLDRDVVGCDRHGVRLAPFARLDCKGHEIRGREGGASGYGVRMDAVEQAEVRNCRISGFTKGIRIRGGQDNGAIENVLIGNGHGIEVAGKTDGGRSERHRISSNEIVDSERDGIHVGAGTSHTVITGNTIRGSAEEGITIEACRSCEVTGNSIEGSGAAAVDLKDSTSGRYLRNVVRGSLFKVRGASGRNLFEDNELTESGYVFAAINEEVPSGRSVPRIPMRNRVTGGSVRDSKVCFRFRGARDNSVVAVEVDGCDLRIDDAVGPIEPSGNTLSDVEVVSGASAAGGGS